MAKKKAGSGISLSEFRAWLQGVEEMQGPNWAPTAEQWKRIKAKFEDVVEEELVEDVVRPSYPQPRRAPVQQIMPAPNVMPSALPGFAPAPPAPQPIAHGMNPHGGQTKTPDIDSSNGYQSSLA